MKLFTMLRSAWKMRRSFDPVLLDRAKALVAEAAKLQGSGEYKRHIVYARLIKDFPKRPRTDLALAVEIALCG